jgi:hypothetical protein
MRYVWTNDGEAPRRPYTIVGKDEVKPVTNWPENFAVGDHWSRTPDDRCDTWEVIKDEETKHLLIVPERK